MRTLIQCTTLLLTLALASCGWHLRGSESTATETSGVTAISLTADDIYTPLYRTFQQEFERRRIALNAAEGVPTLKLLKESAHRRVVSYNTQLDPAEDELTLTIRYQINDQVFDLSHQQTYQRNTNRAAAQENEKDLRIDQMRRELAERILHQVTRSHPQSLATEPRENISR